MTNVKKVLSPGDLVKIPETNSKRTVSVVVRLEKSNKDFDDHFLVSYLNENIVKMVYLSDPARFLICERK